MTTSQTGRLYVPSSVSSIPHEHSQRAQEGESDGFEGGRESLSSRRSAKLCTGFPSPLSPRRRNGHAQGSHRPNCPPTYFKRWRCISPGGERAASHSSPPPEAGIGGGGGRIRSRKKSPLSERTKSIKSKLSRTVDRMRSPSVLAADFRSPHSHPHSSSLLNHHPPSFKPHSHCSRPPTHPISAPHLPPSPHPPQAVLKTPLWCAGKPTSTARYGAPTCA